MSQPAPIPDLHPPSPPEIADRWYCAECGRQCAFVHTRHQVGQGRAEPIRDRLWDGRILTWCDPRCVTRMADRCSGEIASVRGAHALLDVVPPEKT